MRSPRTDPSPPSPGADAGGAAPRTVLTAATVLTTGGPVDRAEVVIEGGLIVEVRSARGPVPDVVLAPGFVDLQVNGIGAVDVATAAGPDWAVLDTALLAQGVTTWCPTLVSAPLDALEAALAVIAEASRRPARARPDIAGAHLEGPYLAVPGAHRRQFVHDRVDGRWLESLADLVRIVTIAPELPGALDAVGDLSDQGVLVSLGHSACTAELAHAATDAGARLVTHLGNAMGPLHHRAPGLLGAALADDRLSVSVIADLVHTHPAFVRLAVAAKGAGRVALVTDAVGTTDGLGPSGEPAPDGARDATSTPGVLRAPPRLSDGTLAGSTVTMERAISNVVTHSGVTLPDAVRCASTTPAHLLGLDDRGEIAPGRRADLVALEPGADGAWHVASVWVAGLEAWSAAR